MQHNNNNNNNNTIQYDGEIRKVSKLSDFAKNNKRKTATDIFKGKKVPIDTILNKEVIMIDFFIQPSRFSKKEDYVTFNMLDGEEYKIVQSGGIVLVDQFKQYKEILPFTATIKKINNYYKMF